MSMTRGQGWEWAKVPAGSAALLLWLICVAIPSVGAERPRLGREQRIAALSRDPRLGGGKVHVFVVDLSTGRDVVAVQPDKGVSVASNAKLVTAAAALSLLGPDFRFKTEVHAGQREGKRVTGDLYLKGYGDPSLDEGRLWQLASDVYDSGIREVSGGLVIDESYFDGQRLAPLFGTRDTDAHYRAPVGALSLNHNAVQVEVRPAAAAGDPATVITVPHSSHVRVRGNVTTVGPGRRTRVRVTTRSRKRHLLVRVSGRVRLGYSGRRFRKRVNDPGLFTARAFLDLLKRRGVRVRGRRVRRDAVPEDAKLLAVRYSRPLAEIVRHLNKTSSNFAAETVLKVIGAESAGTPGTWPAGLEAVSKFLAGIGIRRGSYSLQNGSGLYESSRFSARQIVHLLRKAHADFRYGADFVASLAIAGVDGTLAHRFVGTGLERYVRAKTGTLAGVVALSGYAGAKTQQGPLAFAVLLTGLPPRATAAARDVADEIVQAAVSVLH